jgi:hypothetical protein
MVCPWPRHCDGARESVLEVLELTKGISGNPVGRKGPGLTSQVP